MTPKVKRTELTIDSEAFAELIRSKDEFIVYLQDEVASLKAKLYDVSTERVKEPVEFTSSRGYKSVHQRIRENVLGAKIRHTPIIVEEGYDRVEVND